ncbi:hypothetical protein Q9L58_003011 [Maublancomyces gigas]|uniref:Ubiquitin 3 binding protein But2 C-terminal domain-containing protein n=1 Tax=Discina gigas TaxID=1032678 RepID=A0ABR3GPS0_9PEZI
MKAAIFTSALCIFSGFVSSLAVPAPDADASAIEARAVTTIQPSLIITIEEANPDTAFGPTSVAVVSKINGSSSIQSLIQYNFPAGYSGLSCRFDFSNPITASGTKKVQLFTVGGRQITPTDTFNNRPFRNEFLGTFNAVTGPPSTVWDGSAPTWPCPATAVTLGFEAVPEGDNDHVHWGTSSLVIVVS